MIPRRVLNASTDRRIQNGIQLDKLATDTMKDLNLKGFRSTKVRHTDRKIAIDKYADKVNLKEYAIHHCFNGIVKLVPIDVHKHTNHYGYFYRLNYQKV